MDNECENEARKSRPGLLEEIDFVILDTARQPARRLSLLHDLPSTQEVLSIEQQRLQDSTTSG